MHDTLFNLCVISLQLIYYQNRYIGQLSDEQASVIIYANDTDIVFNCLYLVSRFRQFYNRVYIQLDTSRFLSLHLIADNLGAQLCKFLPLFHAISGNDIASALFGIGKGKMWKAVKLVGCTAELAAFGEGESVEMHLTDSQISSVKAVVMKAYGADHYDNIKEARVGKFAQKPRLDRLPPTESALDNHILRAELSCLMCKQSYKGVTDFDYEDYGWKDDHGVLVPVTTPHGPFPQAANHMIKCNCTTGCI